MRLDRLQSIKKQAVGAGGSGKQRPPKPTSTPDKKPQRPPKK